MRALPNRPDPPVTTTTGLSTAITHYTNRTCLPDHGARQTAARAFRSTGLMGRC
jgi:hypothetical protein